VPVPEVDHRVEERIVDLGDVGRAVVAVLLAPRDRDRMVRLDEVA
jgi:hypothetical protein